MLRSHTDCQEPGCKGIGSSCFEPSGDSHESAELKAQTAAMLEKAAGTIPDLSGMKPKGQNYGESDEEFRLRRQSYDGEKKRCESMKAVIRALIPTDYAAALNEYVAERVRKAVLEAIEDERSAVAGGVIAMEKALQAYEWLIEGRGSYEWDDDRWHGEFSHACANIRKELGPLQKIGADLSNRAAAESPKERGASRSQDKRLRAQGSLEEK